MGEEFVQAEDHVALAAELGCGLDDVAFAVETAADGATHALVATRRC